MSTCFSWWKEEKKALLLGARAGRLWGFAELPCDARSLARYAGLALGAALRLRRESRKRR